MICKIIVLALMEETFKNNYTEAFDWAAYNCQAKDKVLQA